MTDPGPPPTEYDLGCFWHGTEPVPDNAYLVCGECWHCWDTKAAFDADVQKLATELDSDLPADLPFCPLCSHDF